MTYCALLCLVLSEAWRPRRTIKFASWGAEEFGIMGSGEWIEVGARRGLKGLRARACVVGEGVDASLNRLK